MLTIDRTAACICGNNGKKRRLSQTEANFFALLVSTMVTQARGRSLDPLMGYIQDFQHTQSHNKHKLQQGKRRT